MNGAHTLVRRVRWRVAALAAGGTLTSAAPIVFADNLTIRSAEFGTWPQTVAALQSDTAAEGREVHLVVSDSAGRHVHCGQYSLTLDTVSTSAFTIGSCDSHTDATSVRLAHRDALFAQGDVVPRPLLAGISVSEVVFGGARGGAGRAAGTEVRCSVAIRPYLTDLEHGRNVYLDTDRYRLRVESVLLTVQASRVGWTVIGSGRGTTDFTYEVVDMDARNRDVVLRDRASMNCTHGPSDSRDSPVVAVSEPAHRDPTTPAMLACRNAPELISGVPVHGNTANGSDRFQSTGYMEGNLTDGNDDVYAIRVAAPSLLSLHLVRDDSDERWPRAPDVMYLRMDCEPNTRDWAVITDFGRAFASIVPAGTYYVFVDRDTTTGTWPWGGPYTLSATVTPVGSATNRVRPGTESTRALACAHAEPLDVGNPVSGSTVGHRNLFSTATCVDADNGPDAVYAMHLDAPTHLELLLTSDFEATFYIRRECVGGSDAMACAEPATDLRHRRIETTFAAGTTYIVVEGVGRRGSGRYVLTARRTQRGGFLNLSSLADGAGPLG